MHVHRASRTLQALHDATAESGAGAYAARSSYFIYFAHPGCSAWFRRQTRHKHPTLQSLAPPPSTVVTLFDMSQFSVLFVCMGNICRSPTAHGVFRQRVTQAGLASRVRIDSAGTHGSHKGERPDARAQAHAKLRGYALDDLRSRQVTSGDFYTFDLILAMDDDNLEHLRRRCPPEQQHRLRRLTDFCLRNNSAAVPDPYYGNAQGFDHVLDLVEDACDGLLAHLRQQLCVAP